MVTTTGCSMINGPLVINHHPGRVGSKEFAVGSDRISCQTTEVTEIPEEKSNAAAGGGPSFHISEFGQHRFVGKLVQHGKARLFHCISGVSYGKPRGIMTVT